MFKFFGNIMENAAADYSYMHPEKAFTEREVEIAKIFYTIVFILAIIGAITVVCLVFNAIIGYWQFLKMLISYLISII